MPVFNGDRYLAQTIESVISQTYSNWEMILVDDGSTDSTPAVIDQYTSLHPRIRGIRLESPSGGPALPRNKGLSVAKGEYIAFLDADDVWASRKAQCSGRFHSAIQSRCGSFWSDCHQFHRSTGREPGQLQKV